VQGVELEPPFPRVRDAAMPIEIRSARLFRGGGVERLAGQFRRVLPEQPVKHCRHRLDFAAREP